MKFAFFAIFIAISGVTSAKDDDGVRTTGIFSEQQHAASSVILQQTGDTSVDKLCAEGLRNVAPFATASGNGGGSGSFGPQNMNDLAPCIYYWPSGNSAQIQYDWTAEQSLTNFVIRTDPFCVRETVCSGTSGPGGRGIASGVVQYWDGSTWVTDGSFVNQSSTTIFYEFVTQPLVTTRLRVTNVVTHNCGQQNNPTIYEWSVCEDPGLECGNCEIARREPGCEVREIESCVCTQDEFCCNSGWDSKCADRVKQTCDFQCLQPPPRCKSEPVVQNATPFTTCNGTETYQYCDQRVRCNAGFVQWRGSGGRGPLCYFGTWTNLPVCVRPPAITGHLWFISFDNLLFSYHKTGVVRMWESPENDMELQIRTLRPAGVSCDATLTGQVAFRAKDQLITVVGSQDVFQIRFNGVVQTLANDTEYTLGSGPDQLLIEYTPTSLSITSKKGAFLQILFYFMPGMSWLTVPHSLNPNVFTDTTRGLLGVFDGDASNDFTTRNGTVLPVVSFTESNGEQAEFGDSWIMSASESLFGPEEDAIAAADPQYSANPPGSESIECPTEFPNVTVPECDELPEQLIDACYFDVVLGGPQFLDDVIYQPACGNNSDQFCSFHGSCVDDACVCTAGWAGDDCEIRVCPELCIVSPGSTGDCRDDGICDCLPGFTGPVCEFTADCSALNDCFAEEGNGRCVDTNVCECNSLVFNETDCSRPDLIPFTLAPTPAPTPTVTAEPTPFGLCGYLELGSNVGAPNLVDGDAGDVVYILDASSVAAIGETVEVTMTTCNDATNFDTKVLVYTDEALTLVRAQNDDGPRGFCDRPRSSLLTFDVVAGDQFYVVVTGYGARSGSFALDTTCTVVAAQPA